MAGYAHFILGFPRRSTRKLLLLVSIFLLNLLLYCDNSFGNSYILLEQISRRKISLKSIYYLRNMINLILLAWHIMTIPLVIIKKSSHNAFKIRRIYMGLFVTKKPRRTKFENMLIFGYYFAL
jgi:hypothetical protein